MDAKKYIQAMCCVLLIAITVYGWHCFSLGRGSIHCDGSGAAAVGNKLDEVGSLQQGAAEANKRAEELNQSSQIRLDGASRSIEQMQTGTESSAELIRECQSVIEAIRKRGKIKAPQS